MFSDKTKKVLEETKEEIKKLPKVIVFKNPCKYCLTKPLCESTCDTFEYYENTMIMILLLGGNILVSFLMFSLLYFIFDIPGIYSNISVYLINVLSTILYLKINSENVEDWFEYLAVFIFATFLGISGHLCNFDETVELFVSKYTRRFNKKIFKIFDKGV